MTDKILERFLDRQFEEGTALVQQSDLVELAAIGDRPFQRYVVQLRCMGLQRTPTGEIVEMPVSTVGVAFPDDYLRHTDPYQIVMWLGPSNVWHPNISNKAPLMCLGRLGPGTRLTEILYQLFEIVTYQKYATHDALNQEAAAWVRQNQHRLPVDRRPLKRRALHLDVTPTAAEGRRA